MGIKEKGFADWVSQTFPDAVKDLGQSDKSHFDAVCIDVNPLLHACMRNATSESRFVKALFADIDRCLRLTIPVSTVYLAVDGSPPLAKMKEQIRRRRSKAPSKDKHMDSSQITPGCTFQLRVTEYLHYYAARYLSTKHHKDQLQFVVDGAETAGEGEAKIMQYLYKNAGSLNGRQVAVFSGDSDVILQSMLSPVQDIYVLRSGMSNYHAISVARLRNILYIETGGHLNTNLMRVVVDFSVLVMFSGNDYMRKLRGGRISKIWPVYKKFRLESTSHKHWANRYLMIDNHAFDIEVLQELLVRIRRLTIRAVFKPDLSISLAMLGLSDTTKLGNDDSVDGDSDSDPEGDEIPKETRSPNYTKHIYNYLQSLLWTLVMYSTGSCPDVTFTQIGRFLSIEQVLTFLARDLSLSKVLKTPVNEHIPALLTIVCPITLLDIGKAHLVPASWRVVFENKEVRALCHAMINDATFNNEIDRVRTLIYQIGQHIVFAVNPNSFIIQVLTYRQYPVVLTRESRNQPRWAKSLTKLGTSYSEIWNGVEITLPSLPEDPALTIWSVVNQETSKQPGEAHLSSSSIRAWPFTARTKTPYQNSTKLPKSAAKQPMYMTK